MFGFRWRNIKDSTLKCFRNPYCENGDIKLGNATLIESSNPGLCEYYEIEGLEQTASEENCNKYFDAFSEGSSVTKINSTCSVENLIFDKSVVQTSIIQDYDFVCDR